ncbi:MAG: tetratricopeptide repeat protein [Bacteroidetes bacterium]|nr:tetratricopeptide repeat protein [Bacteroidota bacterium]
MKYSAVVLVFVLQVLFAYSSEFDNLFMKANEEYNQGHYADAIKHYEQIVNAEYVSAELYFNLGNAYFKTNEIPSAILYFEKALKLNPNDEDINFNLNVANTKIVDKIEVLPELFIWKWWRSVYNLFSADTWSKLSIFFTIVFFIFLAFYLLSKMIVIRKAAFFSGLVFLALMMVTLFLSIQKYHVQKNQREAIVFSPTITVKSSPNPNSVDLFVLHEGSKVKIIEKVGDWNEIKIANGSVGWLPVNSLKNI